MRPVALLALLLGVLVASPLEAASSPALAKARALYNAGDLDGAINAAAVARRQPSTADEAGLVTARAHLERYRRGAQPDDLDAAREALGSIRMSTLTPRDQVDLLVGLGQSLYLSEVFGAAAELFDAALGRSGVLAPKERLSLLDWWATALDRQAQLLPVDRRIPLFERIGTRMEAEIRDDPGSAPANYWLAVAARGTGDVGRAWNAAVAGWVRASLNPDTETATRTDLDRLVSQALVVEIARNRGGRDSQDAMTATRAEWELVKSQWK